MKKCRCLSIIVNEGVVMTSFYMYLEKNKIYKYYKRNDAIWVIGKYKHETHMDISEFNKNFEDVHKSREAKLKRILK